MTGNLRANIVCNQVLRVVKESNLNYLVKETPYSAFITIRKKFIRQREAEDTLEVTPAVDDLALSDVVLRQENISLRQKFNDLESDKGHLKIEKEDLELKIETLTGKNKILEEKVNQLESENNSAMIRFEVTIGHLDNKTDNLTKQVEEEKVIAALNL
jgi:predicted RNase H-like nuclease (RuvC/YqgF family)